MSRNIRSKHRKYHRCEAKFRYTDAKLAQSHIPNLVQKNAKSGIYVVLEVYECPYCNGFHIGSTRRMLY